MRILIIGAVASGTSAAAKASRNIEEDVEIVLYEKGEYISYSTCGMPYFIGGEVKDEKTLAPRDEKFFKEKYNVDVFTSHEVLSIDAEKKKVRVKNLNSNEIIDDTYDKLVISTGARANRPPIKGAELDNVFTLRTLQDMKDIVEFIDKNKAQSAVIVGTGAIGLEVAEAFKHRNMDVTMIEMLDQVIPSLDVDMAEHVENHLKEKGVDVITGVGTQELKKDAVILADGRTIQADIILLATGVRPNVEIAKEAGIEIGETGAIKVNKKMETNIKDIYACGDCSEQVHLITGKAAYMPLGTTANKTGRIVGENLNGKNIEFEGVLGTGIFRVFDLTVAQTGLSEKQAQKEGYSVVTIKHSQSSRPNYMGGKDMLIKAVVDEKDERLLGVQIIGEDGVDKRIDVFVTAITFKATIQDLINLDLAYAPPYSTTKDPVLYTGMIADNKLKGHMRKR